MRGGKSKIMPKVFQINVTANWGSTGKIAEQIGSCAIQHGWDSYLAYGRMSNPSKNSLIKLVINFMYMNITLKINCLIMKDWHRDMQP